MTAQQHNKAILSQLTAEGVSIWLDDISRDRLRTGNLADLVTRLGRPRGDLEPDDLRARGRPG